MYGFHKSQINTQFCLSRLLPAVFWTDCTKGKSSAAHLCLGIRFWGDEGGAGVLVGLGWSQRALPTLVIPWIPDSLFSVFMPHSKVQQTKSSCNPKVKLSLKIKFRRKVLNSQAPEQQREIPTSFTVQKTQAVENSRWVQPRFGFPKNNSVKRKLKY